MSATPMNCTAPPSLVTITAASTEALVIAAYASMRVDQAEALARSLATGRRWQRRRGAERGAALRAVAQDCCVSRNKVTELAREVRRRLGLYCAGGWRFERDRPAPEDPARARMHRVLTLYDGAVPSTSTAWRALVGIS
jgi:hypothetical protein